MVNAWVAPAAAIGTVLIAVTAVGTAVGVGAENFTRQATKLEQAQIRTLGIEHAVSRLQRDVEAYRVRFEKLEAGQKELQNDLKASQKAIIEAIRKANGSKASSK